jgi:DNA-binding NarL/FixJ family response regulator
MQFPVHFVFNGEVPHTRWTEAFPDSKTLDWPLLNPAANPLAIGSDQVCWVNTNGPWKEVVAWLKSKHANPKIVAVSSDPSNEEGMEAFGLGIKGYCHVMSVPSLLIDVNLAVSSGGLWIGAELLTRMMQLTWQIAGKSSADVKLKKLSNRELEVADAVMQGRSNKEVARMLDITERTVKAHLGVIFEKLEVRDRLQMALSLRGESAQKTGKA